MHRHHHFVAIRMAAVAVLAAMSHAAFAADAPCPMDTLEGEKVALVVGTDDYSVYQQPEAVKNLVNAVQDAKTVAKLLLDQGF